MKVRAGLTVAAAVAGLLWVAPGFAVAASTVKVSASGQGSAVAVCPSGTLVHGTAGYAKGGPVSGVTTDAAVSRVTVAALAPSTPVIAVAVCAPPAAAPSLVTAAGAGAAQAVCPSGTRLLGTGGSARASFLTALIPDSALTSVTAVASDPAAAVTAQAICGHGLLPILVVATSKYDSDSPKSATAKCPVALELSNGAGSIKDGADMVAMAVAVSGESVTATGTEVGIGQARWSVTAYATCVS